MSYIECPQCGHRALGVATRCPRCGFAFPARPLHRPYATQRRDWPSALLAGVIVIGAAAAVATLRGPGSRPGSPERAATRVAATAARSETAQRDSAADRRGPERTPGAPHPSPKPAAGSVTRYARTWVNVRDGRDRAAPAVRVLNPGEQVIVDSLLGGWYRVLAEGQPLGYVHRSNLDAAPPTARP
jgi:ribosomal protein L37E